MIRDHLDKFVDELRAVGMAVSLSDKMDALRALRLVPLDDRDMVETVLIATLVKRSDHLGAFRTIFGIFFARTDRAAPGGHEAMPGAGGALASIDGEALAGLLYRALASGDRILLRLLAREAVVRYGGFQAGRPVGGSYYMLRTLRALDLAAAQKTFEAETAAALARAESDVLGARLRNDQFEIELDFFRKEIEAEVRRLVADDRGVDVLARTVRKPLPEDMDFMRSSGNDIDEMRRVLIPLSRRLATRLQRRRRHGHRGALDFRRTIRRSMAYGGVPADLRFRPPKPKKPELVILADISGSVASFARFTLQLLYTLHDQFSKIRCFVFIDGVSEVTSLIEQSSDMDDLVTRVNDETAAVWIDGYSDYGHAFRTLAGQWADAITHRSTVIILGDARNNYHAAEADSLKALAGKARHIFWLNPEPRNGWNTGDSIVSVYEPYCDDVRECRSLTQLQDFVDGLA